MIEKLSEQDKDLIYNYIKTFGPINDNYEPEHDFSGFDIILHEWDCQKQTLYKLLGNNFIVRRPYTYMYNTDAIVKKMSIEKYTPAYENFSQWIKKEVLGPMSTQDYGVYSMIRDTFDLSVLADNKYPYATTTYYLPPDNEKFKVSKGMRPLRILSKIAQKYKCDEQIFENFRLWHSQMLNSKMVDGELCLSIHPLDFMTMSDNNNNWSSCMSWMDHGDYRCGTIECMNSPYILVAYLHNPEHTMEPIQDMEWNSKHWRELFVVYPEMMSEIKGYCFQDLHLTNTVLMWIKELAENNLGWTYDNDEINIANTIPWNEDDDLLINISPEQYMYNDFGTLDTHRARINRNKIGKYHLTEWQDKEATNWHYMAEFSYGGLATCMWCGQPIEDRERDNAVMCIKCDNGTYCACCGDYLPKNYFYYIDDLDDPICEECFETECVVDDLTGYSHLAQHCDCLHWLIGYDDNNNPIYYDNVIYVYDPDNNPEYFKVFNNKPSIDKHLWDVKYYITLDDVIDKDRFAEIFDLNSSIVDTIADYTAI